MSRRTVLAGIAAIFAAMLGRICGVDPLEALRAAGAVFILLWVIIFWIAVMGVVALLCLGPPFLVLWGLVKLTELILDRLPQPPAPPGQDRAHVSTYDP